MHRATDTKIPLRCLGDLRSQPFGLELGFFPAWRVGGLSKWVISRLTSTLKGILIGVMVNISLENNY